VEEGKTECPRGKIAGISFPRVFVFPVDSAARARRISSCHVNLINNVAVTLRSRRSGAKNHARERNIISNAFMRSFNRDIFNSRIFFLLVTGCNGEE